MNATTQIKKTHAISLRIFLKAFIVLLLLVFVLNFSTKIPPIISEVTVSSEVNADNMVLLTVVLERSWFSGGAFWCYVGPSNDIRDIADDAWIPVEGNECQIYIGGGQYYLFAKDAYGNVSSASEQSVEINNIASIMLNRTEAYLALGGTKQFEYDLLVLGDMDETVSWASSNQSVATVSSGGLVTGRSPGTVTITATTVNGLEATAEVVVTDLINLPEQSYGQRRPWLPNARYTEEEAELLDKILFSRVDEAGYGTRAGAIAAARFLTLEFPYQVPYFFEHGRLNNHSGGAHVDGEGRYYHRGLYLSESKYKDLDQDAIRAGPAYWGSPLINWEDHPPMYTPNTMMPNGLDCSGFIAWTLLNGGFDVGDSGAGIYSYRDDDLCDLGPRLSITLDLMFSGKVKVGDLIGVDGHIAIICGMDEKNIYIAESLIPGVKIATLTINRQIVDTTGYTYVVLMNGVYGGMGNYTEMW